MSFAKIRPRRGTATQWSTANPILAEGEIGIEVPAEGVGTGEVKMKFGDGVTAWNDLPYGLDPTDFYENLIPYPYYDKAVTTRNGITVNKNEGVLTFSGATGSDYFWYSIIGTSLSYTLEPGIYTISGAPRGSSWTTYRLALTNQSTGDVYNVYDEGVTFTLREKSLITMSAIVASNVTLDEPIVFKPMLVKGTEKRDYVPYSLSRQALRDTKATKDTYGRVKLSDSEAVTDSTGLALPATEKNASIEGTLANQIGTVKSDLASTTATANSAYENRVPQFCKGITDWNDAITNGWYMANGASNAPANVWLMGQVTAHNARYVVQEVYAFATASTMRSMNRWRRICFNGTWSEWSLISSPYLAVSGTTLYITTK